MPDKNWHKKQQKADERIYKSLSDVRDKLAKLLEKEYENFESEDAKELYEIKKKLTGILPTYSIRTYG